MLTLKQYLLGKLAEEAAEIAQIAIKTQQFSFNQVYIDESNAKRVHKEIDDLMVILEMLNKLGFGYKPDESHRQLKREKVLKYLCKSVDLDQTDPISVGKFYDKKLDISDE